ncbi:MAG: GNAT family N-acetyltransferase [Pseudomonadota bacterium]
MLTISEIGQSGLSRPLRQKDVDRFQVEMVRTLDSYQKMVALRALTFMAEQDCPFDEEYDGNDLCASHLLAYADGQPIATLRLRWFAGFGKVERVCVQPRFRGTNVVKVMLAAAFELGARKGFRRMTAQIQARLWPLWSRTLNCRLLKDRPSLFFSDYEYYEIEIPLAAHPEAIRYNSDPYQMIRPEGAWDEPGILDESSARGGDIRHVAA